MSIDEASDLYQQFYKEPPMGKTVTVEVEIPDGWELAEPKARHVKPGEYYLLGGELQMWPSRSGISATPFPILRPIPDEKTWERPGWLHPAWQRIRITQGYWELEDRAKCWWPIQSGLLHLKEYAEFPEFDEDGPLAERIWRIVERGEG